MQLEARNIGFRYPKGPWVFQGVDLVIKPGEIVGLIGPSGCGKSTLGRILAGYEIPNEGNIIIQDSLQSVSHSSSVQLVFQHPEKAVNPRWKMEDILNEGWHPNDKLLSSLGIEKEWLHRWPHELSGGELQRFCIARSLGPNTRFLIADEMTTMLDAITQAQIMHAVLEIAQKRELGILIISHEWHLIQRLCNRVVQWDPKKLNFYETESTKVIEQFA